MSTTRKSPPATLVLLALTSGVGCASQTILEPGPTEEEGPQLKEFVARSSFDGPRENRNNWVEMALGEDEDGDGLRELVIGRPIDPARGENPEAQGMVYILNGGSLDLYDELPSIEPHTFGYGVASMGDVDGDGTMDIAVGIPVHADDGGREGYGATHGYLSGSPSPWVVKGNDPIDDFGYSLAYIGGDDHLLLATAARFLGGYAVAIDSRTGEVVYRTEPHELDNDTISERRGYHVVALSDLDGDGVSDFLMTASGQNRTSAFFDYEGRVYLHSGSDGALLGIVEGVASGDQLGTYATTIDDVDGDGFDELLIGCGYESRIAHVSGVAYVLKTGPIVQADGPKVWKVNDDELLIREHIGNNSIDLMGFFVSQVPDMDADGVRDYAVGSPGCSVDMLSNAGCVHIHSGASGDELQVLKGTEDGYWLGEWLVSDPDNDWLYVGTKDYRNGLGRVDSFEAVVIP